MSEAHLKILIDDLSYVASLPIKSTLSTVSYYSNLSEELEKERNLNSLLKAELEEKDEIISILKIRLETERNLYFSQRSELEDKDETIASLIKTDFEKNEELKKAIVESSNYKMILKYANDRNRSLFDGYKILKNEMKEMQDIIDSYICDLKSQDDTEKHISSSSSSSNEDTELEEIFEEVEIEEILDIDICHNCRINKITTFVPCKDHSYCDSCMRKKSRCYICESYLIFNKMRK